MSAPSKVYFYVKRKLSSERFTSTNSGLYSCRLSQLEVSNSMHQSSVSNGSDHDPASMKCEIRGARVHPALPLLNFLE